LVVLIPVVAVFGGWFIFMIAWALTGARAKRGEAIGGSPFWQHESLATDECALTELGAIAQSSPRVAHLGMLHVTNRRLIFTPRRYPGAPKVHEYQLEELADWRIEERRQLGVGVIVPVARPALVLTTTDGREHVLWAAPGYDIVQKARSSLPKELRRAE
jgi:hypothetical protein